MYRDNIILKLQKMIDINTPIIYINDYDTIRINSIIYEAIQDVREWNPGTCLTRFWYFNTQETEEIKAKERLDDLIRELSFCLHNNRGGGSPSVLLLREIQDYITDPVVKSLLASIAQRKLYDSNFELIIIIVSSVVNVPDELMPYISFLDIDFPDDDEIRNIIYRHLYVNEINNNLEESPSNLLDGKKESVINQIIRDFVNERCKDSIKQVETLLPNFRGMMPYDIDRMVDMAMSRNGTLGADDYHMVLDHKKQIVKKSGVLELVESSVSIDDIGGLKLLKEYLSGKAVIRQFSNEATNEGISMPKGIFLVGMPGCGKSLSAQATASLFKEPLLKLDMGTLMGSKVGESERNLRKAIKIAEAAAPCVLWVDEIEKGFAGSNKDDNAYLRRMFGYFLTWLQDKESAVFVIATANNLETLPTEFKRKGRFDDMFFIDLPNEEECEAIFNLKINKVLQKRDPRSKKEFKVKSTSNLIKYVADSDNKGHHFCGADIEYVVNKCFEMIFRKQKAKEYNETSGKYKEGSIVVPDEINEEFLLSVAKNTKCIGMSSDDETFKKMRDNSPKIKGENSPYLSAS